MTKRKLSVLLAVTIVAGASAMPMVRAANDKPAPTGSIGGAAPADGFDPARGQTWNIQQARDWVLANYQKQLEVNTEDFAAIKPKLEAVLVLQSQSIGTTNVIFMPTVPATKPAAPAKLTVGQAKMDLRAVLADKAAKPADIKAKLEALREASAAAKKELAKSQDDLRELLTQRQEATMVLAGLLP